MDERNTEFQPDYALRPGVFLEEILVERGIKKVDFARRCGRPNKTISEIISGKTSITPETALQFERVLGPSADTWLNLESKHQLHEARAKEEDVFTAAGEWAKQFPIREMVAKGFLETRPLKNELGARLLEFFGVSSVDAWKAYWPERIGTTNFKLQKNSDVHEEAVLVWIRRSEIIAEEISCQPYNEAGFRDALREIRKLTTLSWEDAEPLLAEACRNIGVALVCLPFLPKTLRGVAYWATKDKAVIALSDRGKDAALIWFAFFHEAAHILLHSKKAVFMDYAGDKSGSASMDIEDEADAFAAEALIPSQHISSFKRDYGHKRQNISKAVLIAAAEEAEIASDLFLRRLQFEDIVPNQIPLNKQVRRKVEFK